MELIQIAEDLKYRKKNMQLYGKNNDENGSWKLAVICRSEAGDEYKRIHPGGIEGTVQVKFEA
jgi:hypothetical protein